MSNIKLDTEDMNIDDMNMDYDDYDLINDDNDTIEYKIPHHIGYSIETSDDYDYVISELTRLDSALQEYIIKQNPDMDTKWYTPSPFYNTGMRFENDTFHAWAYKWGEEPWEFEYCADEWREMHPDYIHDNENNFYHEKSGCRISWYKHYQRGTYAHGQDTVDIIKNRKLGEIVDDCIASLV